jgi:hypothetical protein
MGVMMSRLSAPGPLSGPRPAAENDVFTVLLVTAFLFLLVATAYVGYRSQSLFGTLLPPGGS